MEMNDEIENGKNGRILYSNNNNDIDYFGGNDNIHHHQSFPLIVFPLY